MKKLFSALPPGARFRLDGEVLTKVEHELRPGMVQCSNALSEDGHWKLVTDDEMVVDLGPPGASQR